MRVVRSHGSEVFRDLKKIENGNVAVGWFPEAQYPDGQPVANVAEKHEFGDRREGIPIRSFMRTTVHEKETEWANQTSRLIESGMSADKVMETMGAVIRGDVQVKIKDIMEPPNSPATVKRKGFNNPLIDTGLMLQSMSFKTGEQNDG